MLDVVRKVRREVIAETNVPPDPNVHQAIAMQESEEVPAGKMCWVLCRKGYTLERQRPARGDGDGSEGCEVKSGWPM